MSAGTWPTAELGRTGESHPEERARILQAAGQYIETVGLTVTFDQRMFDQVTATASVSPKIAHRIWPTLDGFIDDLLTGVAIQARADRADTGTLVTTWGILSDRIGDLRTLEGRRSIMLDIVRTAAEKNLEDVTTSPSWRSYAGLSATILSREDSPERQRIIEQLRSSELSFIETMEMFYRNIMEVVGYRLRSTFQNDFHPLVVATAAVIEGLGLVRASVPEVIDSHFVNSDREGAVPWSLVSMAFVGVLEVFVEPDPDFKPEESIARLSGGVDVTPSAEENPGNIGGNDDFGR